MKNKSQTNVESNVLPSCSKKIKLTNSIDEVKNESPVEDNALIEDNSSDSDIEIDTTDEQLTKDDAFVVHLESELSPQFLDILSQSRTPELSSQCWRNLKKISLFKPKFNLAESSLSATLLDEYAVRDAAPRDLSPIPEFSLEKCFIKPQISKYVHSSNLRFNDKSLTDFQKELLTVISNYHDLYYPEETLDNLEEIRLIYCLHAVNHALKTRLKIVHNNRKSGTKEIRDQGIVRPKVLILLPFRDSALRVVKMLTSLLGITDNVMNKKRFYDEFSGQTLVMPFKNPKPIDYQRTFSGNTNDDFKIGLSITKKNVKLYSDFFSSDIIISSPIALRMLIGGEGEKKDYDFLSSIELLIIDQAEIFTMQNWEHVLHVMNHLHLVPKESHGTDLLRVRLWALNGWSKYYMQTLIFSSHQVPEINALSSSRLNYAGRIVINNPIKCGTVSKILSQIPQIFERVIASSLFDAQDKRFEEFISKCVPQFRNSNTKNVLIYIPSYFDFIRVRNYFKKQDISFVQVCEYTKDGKVARARDLFFHAEVCFMLYTERVHFFKRLKIKGAKHILFYQLPSFPGFYSEMINFMQTLKNKRDDSVADIYSVNVLFTKYDAIQLANIVGTERAAKMIASEQSVHMYMAGS